MITFTQDTEVELNICAHSIVRNATTLANIEVKRAQDAEFSYELCDLIMNLTHTSRRGSSTGKTLGNELI